MGRASCQRGRAPRRRRWRRASRPGRRSPPGQARVTSKARRSGTRIAGRTRSPTARVRYNAGTWSAWRSACRACRRPSGRGQACRPSGRGQACRPSGQAWAPSGQACRPSAPSVPAPSVPAPSVPAPSVQGPSVPAPSVPASRPSGQVPSGQVPSGRVPSGQVPSGRVPSGQVQVPSGPASRPSGPSGPASRPSGPSGPASRPSGPVPSVLAQIRHHRSIRRRPHHRPCRASARSRVAGPLPGRCRNCGKIACSARCRSRRSGSAQATPAAAQASDRPSHDDPSAPRARCRTASRSSSPADCRDHTWSIASGRPDRRPALARIEARPWLLVPSVVLRPPPSPR